MAGLNTTHQTSDTILRGSIWIGRYLRRTKCLPDPVQFARRPHRLWRHLHRPTTERAMDNKFKCPSIWGHFFGFIPVLFVCICTFEAFIRDYG